MEMENLRDRIVRLETTVEHLKENDLKLERKIVELEDKIMSKLDELAKQTKGIEESIQQVRGGWKAITITASAVVGIAALLSYVFKIIS